MGATSWRLARQLLVESVVLSLLGGGLAVWLARSGVRLIRDSLPSGIAQWVGGWSAIGIDARALAYTLGLAAVTSLLFGLVPAHQASRAQLTGLLKEGGRGSGAGGRARLRGLLVISELTLALALLVGAGLMVRGFLSLVDVYQGYDPEGVMTMRVSLPAERYPAAQAARFFESLLERVGATPGVESAAGVSHLPADLGPVPGGPFSIEGRSVLAAGELPVADFQSVSPDYFRTLRVPMLEGRPFGGQDGAAAPPVVIVSDSVARRFWPGEDPVGRRVKVGPADGTEPWRQIVGVARDVKQYWFDREPRLTLYFPHLQSPRPAMTVVVRASGDPQAMAAVVRAQVRGLDPGQPIHEVRTLADAVRQSVAFVRLSAVLMVILGVLALVLSALGVYGVMAYHVSRRTHEIGIRLAVGAAQPEIVRLVMGQALKLTALGLAMGLPLAAGLASVMSSRLFGVVRPDPLGFVAVVLGLTTVAALASYLPARRAAGLDPVIALRRE
jgi:putative ABC transport system permease protein